MKILFVSRDKSSTGISTITLNQGESIKTNGVLVDFYALTGKGYRNKSLTDEQKASNKEKSRTRARIEHLFGFMEQSMNSLVVRSFGIKRATGIIGLINLTYNLFRYEQVIRLNILT